MRVIISTDFLGEVTNLQYCIFHLWQEACSSSCKFPNVCQHLVLLKARLSQNLVCRVVFCRVGRLVERVGVLAGTPVCHRVQGDSVAKRQPLLCVRWSRDVLVFCALVFAVLFRAHVQLRILTPLLDWKRCSNSQSSPFSDIRIVRSNISAGCGCSLSNSSSCSTRSSSRSRSRRNFLACCRPCRNSSCSKQLQICFFPGRLINFECCRVCPWTLLQSSRLRVSRRRLCCEHLRL